MYARERVLTEVARSTAPLSFYSQILDKRTKIITSGMMRRGYYFLCCVCWREIAGLPEKKNEVGFCGFYRVILNSGLTPHAATTDRLRTGETGPWALL